MNRNAESRFALNPINVGMKRSRFTRPSSLKTTFNVGDIVPIYVDEVLPGDTFEIKTSKVVRLQTLLTPVMDNIYLDTYFFFVPNRLVWEHWKNFMGENTESAWVSSTEYEIPQITAPSGGWNVGTIADYLGVRTGVANYSVNALPFRSYALICNEWFRDQNLMDPLSIPTDDTTVTGVNTDTYVTDVAKGGAPYKASKYHDYFTSALPSPQKGPAVSIPVAMGQAALNFPVVPSASFNDPDVFPVGTNGKPYNVMFYDKKFDNPIYSNKYYYGFDNSGGSWANISVTSEPTSSIEMSGVRDSIPSNLVAVPEGLNITVGTINELRMAFAMQKMYERDALGGSRYVEIIKSHFNVNCPDYRLQRPEYLGGNRIPLNINQVIQQSATQSQSGLTTTPQGTVTAMSCTTDRHSDFRKSFTEHGYIIGVCVARYDHTYQQGTERLWSRKDRFDFYDPIFANIGEQAIKNKEIYTQGSSVVDSDGNVVDDQVFGYQEAWAEYRYKPNRVTGEMRSDYLSSLDKWHLGDDYNSLPSLSASWVREDKSNVDRVLAVQSSVSNQLFADLYFDVKCTRIMPLYSVPGLIDHH